MQKTKNNNTQLHHTDKCKQKNEHNKDSQIEGPVHTTLTQHLGNTIVHVFHVCCELYEFIKFCSVGTR